MRTAAHHCISCLFATFALIYGTRSAIAQDPTYGPGEKSVMHDHPDGMAVFLTDHQLKFTYPDGKSEEVRAKAGQTRWTKGGKHLPENITTKPLELILVELKAKTK